MGGGGKLCDHHPGLLPDGTADLVCGFQNDGNGTSWSDSEAVSEGARAQVGRPEYTVVMTDFYNMVTQAGLPHYHGAQLQLPTKLAFPQVGSP